MTSKGMPLQDAASAVAYIPLRGTALRNATHTWHYLWQLLLLHPPCVDALQRIRSLPGNSEGWPQGTPDNHLTEPLRPGGFYRVQLEAISRELSLTFSRFGWWARWLHYAARGHPHLAAPFDGLYEPIQIRGVLSAAPDATKAEVKKALEDAFMPEWEKQQKQYPVPQKNRGIAQPATVAVWLFWSEFLKWRPQKIADAFDGVLSDHRFGIALSKRQGGECKEEAHRIRGLSAPGLLAWPRDAGVDRKDQTVRYCLRTAKQLLSEPRPLDYRPPTE